MKTSIKLIMLCLLFFSLGFMAQKPPKSIFPHGSKETTKGSKEFKKEKRVQHASIAVASKNKRKARKRNDKVSPPRYHIDKKSPREKDVKAPKKGTEEIKQG